MKALKNRTAIILTIVFACVLAVGLVFTFIPMQFGKTKYLSLAGNIRFASDVKSGAYAEYYIDGEYSAEDVSTSVVAIKNILAENGYTNANVYSIANQKIRIEVGLHSDKELNSTLKILSGINVGEFQLRSGNDEASAFINGKQHIKQVKMGSSGSSHYVQIIFNKEGLNKYLDGMSKGTTVYVYFSADSQAASSFTGNSNVPDDLYLTLSSYDEAVSFRQKVELGSLVKVKFDSSKTVVNTMSASLSNVGLTADTNSKNFNKSDVVLVLSLGLTLCMFAGFVYLTIRFRAFGVSTILSIAASTVLIMLVMQALPWVEFTISAFLALAFGYALLLFGAYSYILKVKSEYDEGKTLLASLESGFKKSLGSTIAVSVVIAIVAVVCAVLVGGAVRVCGLIFAIFALANMFSNALLLPWLLKICYGLNKNDSVFYGLGGHTNED